MFDPSLLILTKFKRWSCNCELTSKNRSDLKDIIYMAHDTPKQIAQCSSFVFQYAAHLTYL